MSTKANTNIEKITATNKKTVKHPQTLKEHENITTNTAKEIVFLSKGDIVEVTLKRQEKAKDQKRASPITSSPGQKAERKKPTTSNSEAPRSWGAILREQNLLYMEAQSCKHNENKVTNKNSNAKKVQQNECNHVKKHTGTKSKGIPPREKSRKDSKDSYVLVQDRAVQCPEICNNTNRFAEFNPVHTLSFLMKELKDLITKKDDRTCEIFAEMEQILFRIPTDSAKPISEDLEKLDILEAGTFQLKESNKKVKAMCEAWASERKKLQSLIRERDAQIKEASQKQKEIVLHAEMLKLEEVSCVTKAKDEAISALKEQIINDERTISDLKAELKTELSKQTELARRTEYLKMDKDKLLKLSSYKDTLITQYQNIIIELQTQIENLKLNNLDEVFAKEGSTSSQVSAIQTGLAYSSPTSSFSDHSNKSWHDLSDISTVEHASQEHASQEHVALKEEVPVRDSARLEFVSLLDGESSHTIIPDQSQVMDDKRTEHNNNNNKNNIIPYQNISDMIPKRYLHDFLKKGHDKENDMCKTRKFTKFKEKQKDNMKNSFCHNTSKILENATSKPIISDIRKQGYDMHNRIPVNVPSPLRDYPYPDWSDSSLPSVSTAFGLDMVPSNDIKEA